MATDITVPMKSPAGLVDIIIVNWNSGAQLRACLKSIDAASRWALTIERVVVVDNASSDGSAEGLENLERCLTVLRNATNRGFAAACNQGARDSRADYLLFLNPDTILAPDSLSVAVEYMQRSQNLAIGACGIQLVDEQNRIIRSCSRFPKPSHFFAQVLGLNRLFPGHFRVKFMNEWDHTETRRVDVVTGAFLLVRRAIFEALNGFDERFFVYLEDVDLLYAAHEAGWGCSYLSTAHAHHKQGGCSEQVKALRLVYSLRSRILYGYKHFSWPSATALLAGTVLLEPFTRVAWAAWRRSIAEIIETLQAYARLWVELPMLLYKNAVPRRPLEPSSRPLGSGAAD